jgi:hypothetical protein
MSKLQLGGLLVDTIGQLKVGSSNVLAVYAGSVQVFPASTTTTTSTTSTTTTTLTPTTTTTSTTTLAPTTTTTSTTTSTTTLAPTTTTSTTTSTTTEVPTTTTSTTTTTTTCASLPYSYTLYYDYDDTLPIVIGVNTPSAACTSLTNNFTVYSNSSTFSVGSAIYYDACGTIPISAVPYNFGQSYYKEGSNYITFEADGFTIRSVTACTDPTTTTSTTTSTTTEAPTTTTSTTTSTTTTAPIVVTINWDVREQGSGHVSLVIKDSSNTTLLSQVSSNTGPINGTLSITEAQTPYSIIVSVDAGTEVAQWRVCNDTDSVEIAHNYSVSTTETYIVTPTPLTTSVFATYGDSNTPIVCSVA